MKKLFAMLLCFAILVGVMAFGASAAGSYYVAGTTELCGSAWNPGDANNQMSDPDGDGVYSITYKNVPAGTHQFKVTDGTWTNCWPGSNYEFTLESACDVTIYFNESSKEITVDAAAQGEAPPLQIDSVSLIGKNTPELTANGEWGTDVAMTKTAEGIYEYTFTNIPAGSWPTFKFRLNNSWDVNFGGPNVDGVASGVVTEAKINGEDIWMGVDALSDIHVKLDLTGYDHVAKAGATYTITITPVSEETEPSEPETEPSEPETQPSEPVNPQPEEMITVYAQVPGDWTAANAYVWDGGNNNSWPGNAMTLGENGWYSVQVPAWATNVIINNGNGGQTQDIAIEAGKDIWVTVEATDSGFVGTLAYEAPKTGDSIAVMVALLAISAFGIAVIGKKKF